MMKALQLFDEAERLRRECRFGDAINAFRAVMAVPDATEELISRSQASIELIQEINGFVNTDLMNP